MRNELHKLIVKRYKLRINFFKSKTFSDRKAYTSQRNFFKKLLRNTKRTYFNNQDAKKFTENRTFWKTSAVFKQMFERCENKSE